MPRWFGQKPERLQLPTSFLYKRLVSWWFSQKLERLQLPISYMYLRLVSWWVSKKFLRLQLPDRGTNPCDCNVWSKVVLRLRQSKQNLDLQLPDWKTNSKKRDYAAVQAEQFKHCYVANVGSLHSWHGRVQRRYLAILWSHPSRYILSCVFAGRLKLDCLPDEHVPRWFCQKPERLQLPNSYLHSRHMPRWLC